jgi:pimeloyl-[acyl-carrier protein] methyl ester esterase
VLHIEVTGRGEPLVLLHGWGMHGGVWTEVAQKLAADYEVHSVDLPGYGYSVELTEPFGLRLSKPERADDMQLDKFTANGSGRILESLVEILSARFPNPVNLLGWSLGGQIAQRWAAREPDKVRRLILVTSTPCFSERDDWSFGMAREVLAKFAAELEQNHAATLRRFISLQMRSSENERELLGILREKLFSRGEPDMGALRAGLDILRDSDQRNGLPEIKQLTLVIAGERDKLTPPEASRFMAQVIPKASLVEIQGAAHAPFLSHPSIFIEHVRGFLKNN